MENPTFRPTKPLEYPGNRTEEDSTKSMEEDKIYQLIHELLNPTTREQALLELSKKREQYEDLAPILWHSFGTFLLNEGVISALLQEIVSVYPLLTPPTLTGHGSNRVCNSLALLQCVASHSETRTLFLQGKESDSCSSHPTISVSFSKYSQQN